MPVPALALAVLVLLAPAQAPAEAAADPPDEEAAGEATPPPARNGVLRNLQYPPPGAPADVALWHRANDVDAKLQVARAEATRVQAAAAAPGWTQRLDAAVAGGAVPEERARALRAKLHEEWNELATILSLRWRVDPTRGCRYSFLAFDNVMELADGPSKPPRLQEARGRLEDCVEKAEPILAQLTAANSAMRRALAELDRALAAAGHPAASDSVAAGDSK
jgi:hypothetical protein